MGLIGAYWIQAKFHEREGCSGITTHRRHGCNRVGFSQFRVLIAFWDVI